MTFSLGIFRHFINFFKLTKHSNAQIMSVSPNHYMRQILLFVCSIELTVMERRPIRFHNGAHEEKTRKNMPQVTTSLCNRVRAAQPCVSWRQ